MAISQRNVVSNGGSGNTAGTLTINAPTGTASGDVLFACIVGTSATDFTPPSGWSTLIALNNGDGTAPVGEAVFYKVAGASEPASYTFTSAGATIAGGIVAGYIGASLVSHYDTWASAFTAAHGGSPASSAITTSFAGDLALVFMVSATTASVPNAMTGWTNIYGVVHGIGSYQIDRVGFSQSIAAPGAVASASTTATVTDGWVSVTLALPPLGCIAGSVSVAGHSVASVNAQLQGTAKVAGHSAATGSAQLQATANLLGKSQAVVGGQLQAQVKVAGHSVTSVNGLLVPRFFGAPVATTSNQQSEIVATANQQASIAETSRT